LYPESGILVVDSFRHEGRAMSVELTAILILAGIVGPLQILILGLMWNLASRLGSIEGRLGKVEGLLERSGHA